MKAEVFDFIFQPFSLINFAFRSFGHRVLFNFVFFFFRNKQGEEKGGDEAESQTVQEEEIEANITGSEEMELNISLILEKIENFTQRVEQLLLYAV